MWDWIDRVRLKPKPVRDQYAFFGAAGVTAVIALVWAMSLPIHFAKMGETETGPEQEAIGAFGQFFSEAKTNLGSIIGSTFGNQTTSTATTTETPAATGVVIPTLDTETIEAVNQKQNNPTIGRPVLIETFKKEDLVTATSTNR